MALGGIVLARTKSLAANLGTWTLFLFLLSSTHAQTAIPVTWDFSATGTSNATVGDIVTFTWPAFQDVWINPSLNCEDTTGAIEVATAAFRSSTSYTFQASDAAPGGRFIFFASHVSNGLFCLNGVNRQFLVFPLPTAAPTAAPTRTPQPTISVQPTLRPSSSPTIATPSPTPLPSSAPTVAASASPSSQPSKVPTSAPSSHPSTRPSISLSPSALPISTPSPTGEAQSVTLSGLEMTLFGISDWSDSDKAEWESVTGIYLESYYSDGEEDTGVVDYSTTLTITDSRRFRHRRQRRLQDAEDGEEEESIALTFNQELSYRLANANLTAMEVASFPFGTSEQRNQYVALFLHSIGGGSALVDVTGVSAVDEGEVTDTNSPTGAPVNEPTGDGKKEAAENSSLSTGGVIGIAAASLFVCFGVCLVCNCQRGNEDEDDYDDEDNPYIPPSPDAFAANNKPIEHAFINE